MSQADTSGQQDGNSNGYGTATERGARRRKLAGYLKAANEMRQSYQQSSASQRQNDAEAYGIGGNGAEFADVAIVRRGDEEMVLFPSYARRHAKKEKLPQQDLPGASDDIRDSTNTGDADYWRKEWDRYEDDHAVVDVDIRGWIYSPHRGPMTRKTRILLGLARQLSGVPAPSGNSQPVSRATSTHRGRAEARALENELELVEKEAQSIAQKGAREADIAGRGGYSEGPDHDPDVTSLYTVANESRSPSPSKYSEPRQGQFPHPLTNSSLQSDHIEPPGPGSMSKRSSWNQPANMSAAELSIANANLMARLQPFLANPLISTPITVFFFNDKTSRSRTISTNEAGHFSLRAALDFVPSHVRVLASEKLSATEEVRITEPKGVSLISDIDDTIKHSAIGSGAKEIFRNAFIRDLGDLTIDGVREWYSKMAEMGVQLHYVSNAPWQLYPVLVGFFAGAGLPPGSFHLKQYTGMLQGIFEPVAERKKGTLERILRDFPERRFILVGDSGEADLELYTDIVIANPGRVLGIFIRDVTTTKNQGFFDSSMGPLKGERGSRSVLRGRDGKNRGTSPTKQTAKFEQKPVVAANRPLQTLPTQFQSRKSEPTMGSLIDLDEPESNDLTRSLTNPDIAEGERKASVASTKSLPPTRPSKPLALRSFSSHQQPDAPGETLATQSATRKGPIPPPKPRRYSVTQDTNQPTEPSPLSQTHNSSPPGSRATSLERQSYRSSVRNKVASAYNALPSPVAYWTGSSQSRQTSPTQTRSGGDAARTIPPSGASRPAPPVPPRRNLTSYPAAAAHYATNRLGSGWSGSNTDGGSDDINGNPVSPANKKEELWKRRLVRAKEVLDDRGVVLKTWRVGEDVLDDALRLVEKAKREEEHGPLPKWRSR
ncbi:hypothetical protein MMC24_006958 [Lignoscripta atroalba]|nr:hypothetical protein [Lignoscripta atroalba]